jgi:hypothetical protein
MNESVHSLDLGVTWEPNAPDAVLISDDHGRAILALQPHPGDDDERVVVLVWRRCRASRMEPPNDEAISGHRLYEKGLKDVHWLGEVTDSEWIADLERRNRVHRYHDPGRFDGLRHFVLPLKETTVEVVARSVEASRLVASSNAEAAVSALHGQPQ